MAAIGDMVVRILGDISDFDKAIGEAQKKMNSTAENMAKIGKNLTAFVTLPILGIGAATVKVVADFETSMNRVRALTGATGSDFEKLEKQARELGATTQFSASEAAGAMGFLAMAGFDAEKIYAAMPNTLNLAAAAQIDMASAADIVTNIMSGFNMTAEELGATVDILTEQFTNSNTDLVQLGEAMKFVGPVAQSFGVSIEEVAASIGIMSDAGIQGSMAGTGLRRILGALSTESDKLGITTIDSAGKMRPLVDILADLEKTGIDATSMLEIFGDRGGPAMAALLSNGSKALADMTKQLGNAGGTAERIAKIQMEGVNGQLKTLRSVSEEAAIGLGNIMLPAVNKIIGGLAEMINKLNAMDNATRGSIITYGLLAAAIGPVILVVTRLIKLVPQLQSAFALMAANPVIVAILALGAAVAVIAVEAKKAATQAKAMKDALEGAASLEATQTALKLKREEIEYQNRLIKQNEALGNQGRQAAAAARIGLERLQSEERQLSLIYDGKLQSIRATELQNKEASRLAEVEAKAAKAAQIAAEAKRTGDQAAIELAETALEQANREAEEIRKQIQLRKDNLALVQDSRAGIIAAGNEIIAMETGIREAVERGREIAHEKELARIEKEKQARINAAQFAYRALVSIGSQLLENEISRIEASTASEETKAEKIAQAKVKQAKWEKAQAIISVAIDTANAVTKALPNLVLAGIVGGLGAAQAGIIASQKIPPVPMAEGGVIMPRPGGTLVQAAEKNQPEVFFPLDKLEQFLSKPMGELNGTDGGTINLVVQLDSKPILDKIFPATRNRTILISAGAIV